MRTSPQSVKHFITISDFSRNVLKGYFTPEAYSYRVPNPIEIEKQSSANPSNCEGVVFVGRLGSEKGCRLLAEATAEIDMKVTFIGEGESSEEIRSANPKAEMAGWLQRDDLFPMLKRSRALVLPSICYETQGLVVLEAAALGIPAVIPDTSAARGMVEDGVTGLWFKGSDKDDLKRVLLRLSDNSLVSAMGKNAYERFWSAPPTLDKHADRLDQIYRAIITRDNPDTNRSGKRPDTC